MTRVLFLLVSVWLLPAMVLASEVDDRLRELVQLSSRRQDADTQRGQLAAEAASLAATIVAAGGEGTSRATPALQRQLHEFERVVTKLDAAERAVAAIDHQATKARTAFDHAWAKAADDLRKLDLRQAAVRRSELDEQRRRVDALGLGRTSMRPLLVVRPASTDTVSDLDRKLTLLAAEQTRGQTLRTSLAQELAVLRARIVTVRQQRDLATQALASAPQDLRLLQMQEDQLTEQLRSLEQQRDTLMRTDATLQSGLADVSAQMQACRQRRQQLLGTGGV